MQPETGYIDLFVCLSVPSECGIKHKSGRTFADVPVKLD